MDDHTVLNSIVQRVREGEGERDPGVDLGRFMTPGLSKDIQCHW